MHPRRWFLLGLACFGLVTSLVIWRRSVGNTQARRLTTLESERVALEATAEAEAHALRTLRRRRVLMPAVTERLGMRVPSDSEVVLLVAPRTPDRDSATAGH